MFESSMLLFFFFDPLYFLIMLPFFLLSMVAAGLVKGTFNANNKKPIRSGASGLEAAQMILNAAGLQEVRIREVPGMLSDHYNPLNKTVNLSTEILKGKTPAAVAVAAHECGHALQHAAAYLPMQARSAMVPVVNFASTLAFPMIIAGIFFTFLKGLILIGIIAFTLVLLFHLVTLPVEFDASRRAIKILGDSGLVAAEEMPGVRKTLYAAGFTYVASALVAAGQLLYLLLRSGFLGGDD